MDTDLDTLATALYVTADDLLKAHPEQLPGRPAVGIEPLISDAELIVLSAMQAHLGYRSEARWLRRAHKDFHQMFPYLPAEMSAGEWRLADAPGIDQRRARATWRDDLDRLEEEGHDYAGRFKMAVAGPWTIAALTRVAGDDVWIADSTPVECGRSRETAQRSDLAGWAEYGYCASHTRYFWGLRLHGLHSARAAGGLGAGRGENRRTRCPRRPVGHHSRPGPTPRPAPDRDRRQGLLRPRLRSTARPSRYRPAPTPPRKGEKPKASARFFRPLRQIIESVNDTFKGQLDLELPGGRTPAGVCVRIAQRVLALVAAIWHNDHTGAPILRSLVAYDH